MTLSGQHATLPQLYQEEKWVRFSPAIADTGPVHLMAAAETSMPLVKSLARR